jgi:hypothetical protein
LRKEEDKQRQIMAELEFDTNCMMAYFTSSISMVSLGQHPLEVFTLPHLFQKDSG